MNYTVEANVVHMPAVTKGSGKNFSKTINQFPLTAFPAVVQISSRVVSRPVFSANPVATRGAA